MADGRHYKYEDINSILPRVLIAQPGGKGGPVTVYVPPVGGALPYTVDFEHYDEAERFAVRAHAETPFADRAVLYTQDREPWWLVNLTAADEA